MPLLRQLTGQQTALPLPCTLGRQHIRHPLVARAVQSTDKRTLGTRWRADKVQQAARHPELTKLGFHQRQAVESAAAPEIGRIPPRPLRHCLVKIELPGREAAAEARRLGHSSFRALLLDGLERALQGIRPALDLYTEYYYGIGAVTVHMLLDNPQATAALVAAAGQDGALTVSSIPATVQLVKGKKESAFLRKVPWPAVRANLQLSARTAAAKGLYGMAAPEELALGHVAVLQPPPLGKGQPTPTQPTGSEGRRAGSAKKKGRTGGREHKSHRLGGVSVAGHVPHKQKKKG